MSNAASRENRKVRSSIPVREGSGNVFEDLGVPESAEALAKAEIAARIATIIETRGLTQAKAADVLDVSQADVSDLVRGKLRGFSTERLFRFLNALGQDIQIVILARNRPRARAGSLRVVDGQPRAAVAGSRSRR
jgi:predicted XRE-type DNA-binding protein